MASEHPPSRENGQLAPEEIERAAAWRRGHEREMERAAGLPESRDAYAGHAPRDIAARAFAALAENVRDYAIFLMDPTGVITFWGEGARLVKWWTKDEAEGGHLRMLYPPNGSDDGTAEGHLQAAAERGEYTGEGHRVRSDGSTFWAGVTLTALWDDSGTLLGFAKVTRDLTARRAADALLQSAAEAAEAASVAKSGFLATMSHEIRTPINAVMGYIDLLDLETDGPLNTIQRRHLVRAKASAVHLLSLVSEVLDFSRIEADGVRIGRTVFRVGDAVAGAMTIVAPDARAKGIELVDAVSGYAAGLAAWGDEPRVRQILVNLLVNAVKFTAPRDGAGRITVSAGTATQASPGAMLAGPGPWVYLRVEDTGEGIAADRIEPIFEPFVQGDMTLTRGHGGTGLGLAISRRLARLMGGDVTARSELGVGSTFFVWLAAAPVQSLETGGLEGHGPGSEDADETQSDDGGYHRGRDDSGPGTALTAVSSALMSDLERVLHAFVARVHRDPEILSAHSVPESQLEDHLASFLADLASTFQLMGAAVSTGAPTPEVLDGTAIQRIVAERHGAQRARLGWHEDELHREFAILGEELAAAIKRRAPDYATGPTPDAREGAVERALEVLRQFIAFAEGVSVASWRAAVDNQFA